MNISNLQPNTTYKNYKQLCQILNEPVKGGNAKKSQLEDWKCYFSYSRDGNKYIVNEIYETPLIRFNNKGVYHNLIQLIILDYLMKTKNKTVYITANKLLLFMYMYNENYNYCIQYIDELSKYTNIQKKTIYDFYNTSYGNFRNALESGLNGLRNKALLMYEKLIYVCTSEHKHRRATEEEKYFINKAEKEIMVELGFKDMTIIRVSPLWNKFKRLLIERLDEINIRYHYICYSLTVNRDYIESDRNILLQCTLDEIETTSYKHELNQTVINRLTENAQIRRENGFTSHKKAKMRNNDQYIKDITALIDILVNINAEDIKEDIQQIIQDERKEIQLIEELENLFS